MTIAEPQQSDLRSEKLRQIGRQLRPTSVVRIGRDEDTDIGVDLQALAHQLDLDVRVLRHLNQTLLDRLHLLGDGTENSLLQSIELIKASPCTDLTKANEDTTHGLEIEGFVATENQDETSQLNT